MKYTTTQWLALAHYTEKKDGTAASPCNRANNQCTMLLLHLKEISYTYTHTQMQWNQQVRQAIGPTKSWLKLLLQQKAVYSYFLKNSEKGTTKLPKCLSNKLL